MHNIYIDQIHQLFTAWVRVQNDLCGADNPRQMLACSVQSQILEAKALRLRDDLEAALDELELFDEPALSQTRSEILQERRTPLSGAAAALWHPLVISRLSDPRRTVKSPEETGYFDG